MGVDTKDLAEGTEAWAAAAALVFGQFVGRQPLSWTVIVTGVTI